jgi:hypothetical protein
MQFKEGDMVSVFEGTHHRGKRNTKFIGRVIDFDTEKNLWKVRTLTLTLISILIPTLCCVLVFVFTTYPNPYPYPNPNPLGSKCFDGEEGATIYG